MRLSHDLVGVQQRHPNNRQQTHARQADRRCEIRGVCVCVFFSFGGAGEVYLRVHGFVLLQADCVPKRFAADFTRERPSAAVRSADVHLQSVRR